MDIMPAIDLRNGRCVRLLQGNYERQINYSDDPVAQARQFASAGATWLHVVDLDGAKEGRLCNLDAIAAIIRSTAMRSWLSKKWSSTGSIKRSSGFRSKISDPVGQVVTQRPQPKHLCESK